MTRSVGYCLCFLLATAPEADGQLMELDDTVALDASVRLVAVAGQVSIALRWVTDSEEGVSGFRLERGETSSGPFSQSGDEVPAIAAGLSEGHAYEAIDGAATRGTTWWYRLVVHHLDGTDSLVGPVSASLPVGAPGGCSCRIGDSGIGIAGSLLLAGGSPSVRCGRLRAVRTSRAGDHPQRHE